MKKTTQTIICPGTDMGNPPTPCESSISIEVTGVHELRSTSTSLEELATDAGWKDGRCPVHRIGIAYRVKQ